MFTTTITISNPNTRATNFDSWSNLFIEFIGADVEDELNYIRSDHILDGKMKEEAYKGWDNDAKTAKLIYFHEKSEDMRDYQLALTENALSVEGQRKLHDAGWTIEIKAGTADNTSIANKLHVIDERALENVRPERRQEVLDNISSE